MTVPPLQASNQGATRVFGYRFTYWMPRWMPRRLIKPLFGFGAFASALQLVRAFATNTPPRPFVAIQLAFVMGMAYLAIWATGYSVEVRGTTLTWKSLRRTRAIEMTELTGHRSVWLGYDRLTLKTGRGLLVAAGDRSWLQFLASLNEVHKAKPFSPTRRNLAFARLPWSNLTTGYYEYDDDAPADTSPPH